MGSRWRDIQQAIVSSQFWKSIFRVGIPEHQPQARARDAGQRRPASASGQDPQVRRQDALHVVRRRRDVFPLPRPDVHGPAPDVLLPADRRVRLRRHPRPARAGAFRDHARSPPLGRARDGHLGLDPHVPGLHDRLLQAAPRVQLGHRRDPPGPHAAALVHRVPAAVGSARDLGHHGRFQHGVGDAAARDPGPRHVPAQDRRHPARDVHERCAVRPARRPLRGRRRAPALLRSPLRRDSADRGLPDGGPLLARPQGRRHFRVRCIATARTLSGPLAGRPTGGDVAQDVSRNRGRTDSHVLSSSSRTRSTSCRRRSTWCRGR